MSLESLKRKLHILRSLSRLRRINGVVKMKQVKQFWIRNMVLLIHCLERIRRVANTFFDSVSLKLEQCCSDTYS